MKHATKVVLVAGVTLAVGAPTGADVIVRLHSGPEFRASSHWVENGLLKFEHRGGIVGFRTEEIAAIVEPKPVVRDGGVTVVVPQPEVAPPEAAAPAAAAPGAATADPAASGAVVASLPGEDLVTRQERLDKLAVETFQELTNARHHGEPKEKLDALQAKLDEINRLRSDGLNRLKAIR